MRPLSLLLWLTAGLLSSCASQPDPAPSLRVMTWNIHHGRGLDGRVDLERIAQVIRAADVDVVCLQEVDRGTRRTDGIDMVQELAKRLGMHGAFGKNLNFQDGSYGNATLSRLPIVAESNHHYRMLRAGEQRGLLEVTVAWHGREVAVWNTHLDYRPDNAERLSSVDEMLTQAVFTELPVLVCGDFNDLPGSAVHERALESSLKTELRAFEQNPNSQGASARLQFRDAWQGAEPGGTYPADAPTKRIDWILTDNSWETVRAEVTTSEASDHRPVVVELRQKDS